MTQASEFAEPATVTPSSEPAALAKIKNDLLLEESLREPALYIIADVGAQGQIAMGLTWRLEERSPLPDSDVRVLVKAGANVDPVAIGAAVAQAAAIANRDFRIADVIATRTQMLAQVRGK